MPHGKVVCSRCGSLVSQCRCMAHSNNIQYVDGCKQCKAAEPVDENTAFWAGEEEEPDTRAPWYRRPLKDWKIDELGTLGDTLGGTTVFITAVTAIIIYLFKPTNK